MNSINRFAVISAAMVLSAAALTGCGNTAADNTGSGSAVSEAYAAASTEKAQETVGESAVLLAKYSEKSADYDEQNAVKISFDESGAAIDGQGAAYTDGTVTISAGGEYIISGITSNGRIAVNCSEDENVRLILDNADISCGDGPALLVTSAKNVYLILKDGTDNKLSDSASYTDGDNLDGCIFSKADLIICGGGTLNVNGNYKHGIVSKDDLAVIGGTLNVTAASSGICGKDLVEIDGGSISVTAGNDGIKSTNTEDADKGNIIIGGGNITVVSEDNCISSAAALDISGGVLDLTAGGGYVNAEPRTGGENGGKGGFFGGERPEGNGGDVGFRKHDKMTENGEFTPPEGMPEMNGEMPEMSGDMQDLSLVPGDDTATDAAGQASAETSEESSAPKGIKAETYLTVSGGELTIDAAGDGIHSNGNVTVSGGTVNAAAGSQGIHADSAFLITDGDIIISESFEGIEAKTITVNGGNISAVSSDDGFNGTDGSGSMNMFESEDGVYIEINGGVTELNAGGDGIDSNGAFYLKGGEVYVSGPTNSGNGSLDCNGTAEVSGGVIIACGAAGMAQGFGSGSAQYSVVHTVGTSVAAGEELTVSDSEGNVILSHTFSKEWQNIIFSSPDIEEGETYTISAGNMSETVNVDGIVTSNSSGSGKGFGRMK
ncbi:MAG: carbohydrate-binding domain-containing protein [Oscillospiraceae bacterium]|nr:carbohydrate-binding domain-containing protein [Oscillospiraceae bacterium]